MVMGRDSRSEGRGFKSQCGILDGHFFTIICCKIELMFVCKRPKINEKEAGDGPFKKIEMSAILCIRSLGKSASIVATSTIQVSCGQSCKHSMIVIYASSFVL